MGSNNTRKTGAAEAQPQVTQTAPNLGLGGAESATFQNPTGGAPVPPPAGDNVTKLKSVLSIGTVFGGVLNKSPETEWVRKYIEKYHEITGEKYKEVYKLISIDGKRWGINVSAMVIVGTHTNGGVTAYAAHTMLVEASVGALNPYSTNYGGIQIEIQTVVGDLFTSDLWDVVKQAVVAELQCTEVHFAGYSVLPVELNPEDHVHMQACISDAFEAVYGTLGKLVGGIPIFQLSMLPKSDRLQARIDCTLTQEQTSAGLPVRSDITVTLSGVQNQQQFPNGGQPQNWNPANIAGAEFTRICAYVEAMYAPPMIAGTGMAMLPQMMAMDTRYFDPRVVITQIESRVGRQSLEFILLAVHQATLLSRNMSWATPFRPRVARAGGSRTRDIGALGLDIPALVKSEVPGQGDIIDTQSNNFGDNEFYTLLTSAFRTDPIYAIDIEEAGQSSWLLSVFKAAADPQNTEAYQEIVKAADNLTNNKFSQIFTSLGAGGIINNDNNRIHMGYYTNSETNKLHDIRDLDYLCLLNLVGKTDHGYAKQFEATYTDLNVPSEIRLQERYKIMQNVLRETMKLKGYASRFTFYPNFLKALGLAIQYEGFNINPVNLAVTYGANQNRGFHSMTQFAFGQANMGNAFSFAQPTMAGGGMFMPQNQWGWGR